MASPDNAHGSAQTVQVASLTLNDAQIRGLPTTNVPDLVAAPGAGLAVVAPVVLGLGMAVLTAELHADYGNIDAGASWQFFLDGGADTGYSGVPDGVVGSMAAFLAPGAPTTHSWLLHSVKTQSANTFSSNPVENVKVGVYVDNQGSGDLTGGNAANTLTVSILYSVVEVS